MPRPIPQTSILVLSLAALALAGCGIKEAWEKRTVPQEIKDLGKSDLDFVLDAHLQRNHEQLQELMKALYAVNPLELAKTPGATAEERVAQVLPAVSYQDLRFAEIEMAQGVDAMLLAFSPLFEGDRVFALMVGITSQMRIAYSHQLEFFIPHVLNPQNMRNFTINLDIIRSRLAETQAGARPILSVFGDRADGLRILDQMIGQQQVLIAVLDSRKARGERAAVRAAGTVTVLPIAGAAISP